jgi:hypothetical protein
MSHLGKFFRQRRVERNLDLGPLARLLGFTNLSRGANRIQVFEGGGKVMPDLLAKLAEVLEIGPDEIRQKVAEDYRDWLAWANEPVRPHVVVRLLACVYQRVELPEEALEPEAVRAFASRSAVERKLRVCLVLSKRVSVWFDAMGRECGRTEATPEMPCEPFAVIGGKRIQFDFGGGGVGPHPVNQPGQ